MVTAFTETESSLQHFLHPGRHTLIWTVSQASASAIRWLRCLKEAVLPTSLKAQRPISCFLSSSRLVISALSRRVTLAMPGYRSTTTHAVLIILR